MANEQNSGLTGAVKAGLPTLMTMVAFMTISLYNVLDLTVIIFATFKRRTGLYFWSFLVATWGIAPHTIGFIILFFGLTSTNYLPCTMVACGWVAMVSGQSLVLYSRLHLVTRSAKRIRWVLYMIIFNFVFLQIPDIILAYGATSPNPARFVRPFSIIDKIQIAVFFAQESIISALYIYETIRLLGPGGEIKRKPLRKLLAHLMLVNILVLVLDITVLGIQYSGYYEIQTSFKAAAYSLKLKIEFSVLNRLVDVVQNKNFTHGNIDITGSNPFDAHDSSAATQVNTLGSASHGGFIKMDDTLTIPKDSLQPKVKTTEVVTESGESGNWIDNAMMGRRGRKRSQPDIETL